MLRSTCLLLLLFCAGRITAQSIVLPVQQDRWTIEPDGSIAWRMDQRVPHADHVEMSGQQIAVWAQYGVDTACRPHVTRTFVFPAFRLQPNKTASSMMYTVPDALLPHFLINDRLLQPDVYNAAVQTGLPEKTTVIQLNGMLQISSRIGKDGSLELKQTLSPSADKALAVESFVFTNKGSQPVTVEMESLYSEVQPAETRAIRGPLRFVMTTKQAGAHVLQPGDSFQFGILYQALRGSAPALSPGISKVLEGRRQRVREIAANLQLFTPDTLLNTAFAFAKTRATESIFLTKGGYMHGPGGLRYYAAIWANDQAEYVNPFFAWLGDHIALQSAMNAYRMFGRYMNAAYEPIPSSIIAEGDGIWHGKKDRGDMAMIAYGASRFALAYGNRDSANVLWPLIEWCLEYLHRKLNAAGVVNSNSDELEGRFPSGNANLHTSVLYYDALQSAAMLGAALGKPASQTDTYKQQAAALRQNIEQFFGAEVEGFHTYRYYEGNTVLRAWICSPLIAGIFERRQGTIDALFSPRLWTADGLASQAGDSTFWDRATLYALRGALIAGETGKAMNFLEYYSRRRLLGEHVPYPVEAYPEGNQRHLAAESGLYCRIYTEGLFGMRPLSLHSFSCTPRLPAQWPGMSLKNIHAFQRVFDIDISRLANNKLQINIVQNGKHTKYTIKEGETQIINL